MISRPAAVIVCSIFLATVALADYPQPLLAGQIQPDAATQSRDPAMTIIALCWDGNDFSDECSKHSTFLRQLLKQQVHKLKMETRQRNQLMKEPNLPARKRQDDSLSFYSNW